MTQTQLGDGGGGLVQWNPDFSNFQENTGEATFNDTQLTKQNDIELNKLSNYWAHDKNITSNR